MRYEASMTHSLHMSTYIIISLPLAGSPAHGGTGRILVDLVVFPSSIGSVQPIFLQNYNMCLEVSGCRIHLWSDSLTQQSFSVALRRADRTTHARFHFRSCSVVNMMGSHGWCFEHCTKSQCRAGASYNSDTRL